MATSIPPEWLDRAGALYLAGVRSRAPLDRTVALFLRRHRRLSEEGRGFVVELAQRMWRVHARIESAVRRLDFEPTRGALACMVLIAERDHRPLPIDSRGAAKLCDAWRDDPLLPPFLASRLDRDLAEALTRAPPTTLRANTLKTTREGLRAALQNEGILTEDCAWSPDGVRVLERKPLFRSRAFAAGLFEMQDEGSQLIARLCGVKAGDVVVDGCAGAGGKTLHLAALMKGSGTIYALDVQPRRLDDLRTRAKRAGAHNIRVNDAGIKKRLRGRADVVLVDAPCSGTGVLRRNPDIAWKLKEEDVVRLAEQQRAIVAGYLPLLKEGGRLVYATCSLLREENEAIADSLQEDLERVRVVDVLKEQGIHVPGVDVDLRLDPARHGTDGFYAAVFRRVKL